jgi:hypothetical protein
MHTVNLKYAPDLFLIPVELKIFPGRSWAGRRHGPSGLMAGSGGVVD